MKNFFLVSVFVFTSGIYADVSSGKFGANFQYGNTINSIGVWYHIFDAIAVSPFVGYSTTTTVVKNSTFAGLGCGALDCTVTTKTNDWNFGIEVPIYVAKLKAMHFFLSPLASYGISNGTTKGENASTGRTGENENASSKLLTFGIYAGLQIPVLDQLHLFGRGGFEYAIRSTTPASNSPGATYADKTYSFGSGRYSIGAIFYFN